MRTKRELTSEEHQRGVQLMRRCDAYTLLSVVLEEAEARGDIRNTDDLENMRAELRVQKEEADIALAWFKRNHGVPAPHQA